MPKNKGIYRLFRTKAELDQYDRELQHFARAFLMDDVTIALGRMGFRETKFREFDRELCEVCKEYAEAAMDDYKDDKDLWYSKAAKDREIQQYTGTMFEPWEERYKWTAR